MDTLVSRKPPSGAGPRKASKESKASHKALIANNLKKVYDQVAKEPLPPELQSLLNQLEEGGKS
jgi:anti-sigma factor NepR-like protein